MNLESGPRTAALIKENRSPDGTRHPPGLIPGGHTKESPGRLLQGLAAPNCFSLGVSMR